MIHDFGVVIERVREFFRIRPVAVSEARDNPVRQGDSDQKAGRREARTFAMKREVHAIGESLAHPFGPASL